MTAVQRAQLPEKEQGGYVALAIMEGHLSDRGWFVGEWMSIADIALYAYTHVAGEGGFDLARFPAITDWFARVEAQPGHVPMKPAPVGRVAPACAVSEDCA